MSDRADISEILEQMQQLQLRLEGLDAEAQQIATELLDAHDRFHRAGLAQLIRGIKAAPATASALRDAASDSAVYAMLRHHKLVRASLQEQVETALDTVRPALRQHGGDVEVDAIDNNAVTLRFVGQCDGCSASGVTFREGVEKALREQCDWIETIHLHEADTTANAAQPIKFVSPFDRVEMHEPESGAGA